MKTDIENPEIPPAPAPVPVVVQPPSSSLITEFDLEAHRDKWFITSVISATTIAFLDVMWIVLMLIAVIAGAKKIGQPNFVPLLFLGNWFFADLFVLAIVAASLVIIKRNKYTDPKVMVAYTTMHGALLAYCLLKTVWALVTLVNILQMVVRQHPTVMSGVFSIGAAMISPVLTIFLTATVSLGFYFALRLTQLAAKS